LDAECGWEAGDGGVGHETACGVGRWYEFYSYTAAGLVTKKRLRLQRQNYLSALTAADMDGVYGWNNEGQMTGDADQLWDGAGADAAVQ